MGDRRWAAVFGLGLTGWLWLAASGWAEEPPADWQAQIKGLEAKVHDATLSGNNAWMLVSSALLLFMTAPGLALLSSGLVCGKACLGVFL